MKTAITIAGSDSSGGAGIQADIKTMITNGVYAMSAITALTAQNTTGVTSILNATPEFLGQELDSIFTDIYPDAVKIGMVSDKELIKVIAAKLRQYEAKNIVVDPVMVATSGAKLISDDAADTLKEELFPLASVLTPNIPEAEELIGRKITSAEEMIDAAKEISEKYHCAVLCKGGHNLNDANDLLYADGVYRWFNGKRIDNPNTHGTGCTLSSAIASNLAKGFSLEESVERAKEYISGALAAMLDLGKGSGPMDHGFAIQNEYTKEAEASDDFIEKTFTGPIWKQVQDALDYINTNVIEEKVVKLQGQAESERFFNYPYNALEEALVNAVFHKSYREQEPVEIRIYVDSIQILNYPGLAKWINLERFAEGRIKGRKYRNRRIGELFKEIDLSEKKGTGIPKILRELKKNGSPGPEFDMDDDRTYLNTIIHIRDGFDKNEIMSESMSKSMSESMSELEIARIQVILQYLTVHDTINSAKAAELLDVEKKTASRLLSKAEKVEVLISKGKTKDKVYMKK